MRKENLAKGRAALVVSVQRTRKSASPMRRQSIEVNRMQGNVAFDEAFLCPPIMSAHFCIHILDAEEI